MQNNDNKVSIIMPCYNQADFVAEAIDSVIQQTYTNWELIIINDGSTDNSQEIIEQKINNIENITLLNIENGGVSNARNKGIAASSGAFILPLDADDIISNDYLQLAMDAFSNNNNIKLVYAKAQYFGLRNEEWELIDYNYKTLLTENHIYCSAVFRKSDFEKTNGYDTQLVYGQEDWDLWLCMLNELDIVYKIPKICFYYRIKNLSRSVDLLSNQIKIDETFFYIYKKHLKTYNQYFGSAIASIRKADIINNKNELFKKSTAYKVTNVLIKLFSLFKK